MKKDIYNLLNNTKTDTSNYNIEPLTEIEKRRLKNNFKTSIKFAKPKKKKYIKIISISAACLLIIFGISATPVGAKVLFTLYNINDSIQETLHLNKNFSDYSTTLNQVITKDGLSIKLNNVAIDNGLSIPSLDYHTKNLTVSTLLEYNGLNKNTSIVAIPNIYVDGVQSCTGGYGSGKFLSSNLAESLITYSLHNIDFNKPLYIKIVYPSISILIDGKKTKTVKGPFVFKFKDTCKKLLESTKEENLNIKIPVYNRILTIQNFSINKLNQSFTYNLSGSVLPPKKSLCFQLQGTDNLGDKVLFSGGYGYKNHYYIQFDNNFYKFNPNAKTLHLRVYYYLNKDVIVHPKPIGHEFTVNLK